MNDVTVQDIEDAVRQEFSGRSANTLLSTDAMWEAHRKAKVARKAPTPGIATALILIGMLDGILGSLMVFYGFAAELLYYVVFGLSGMLSGCVIGGFGKVIEYLAKIEHHLRPEKEGMGR